jgi:hypothetical protein
MPRNEIAAIIGAVLAVVTALAMARGRQAAPGGNRFAPIAAAFLVGFAATWIVLFLVGY